jgi:hypothetical protein
MHILAKRMHYPAFFDAAPVIELYDPLAEFLGAVSDGVIEYRYADVVRFAGHSCPTVACAFLMTRAGLNALYPDALPWRGDVRVEMRARASDGVAGVIAGVAGFITGAAHEGGFKGIGGRFKRRGLLQFGVAMSAEMRFTRTDSGEAVELEADAGAAPPDPKLGFLFSACVEGTAGAQDTERFGTLWQARVRALLLEHAEDPACIVCRRSNPAPSVSVSPARSPG